MQAPAALAKGRMQRNSDLVNIDIELYVQLRRGSPFLECTTTILNRAQDHRLRALFPTCLKPQTMRSLAAFDSVDRPLQPDPTWVRAESCRPQLGWTSISDGDAALTVLSGDLPEVEAMPMQDGVTLALTLLRCVGAVSRRTSTPMILLAPEAQLLGEHTFSFAIYPHMANLSPASGAAPELTPDQALALFKGVPLLVPAETTAGNERMRPCTLVETDQPSFVITAVEPAPPEYGGSGVVVRGWNAAAKPVAVQLHFGMPVASTAYRTDLAGNRLEEIRVERQETDGGPKATVTVTANQKEIVTVLAPVG
jgi:alpha-mannosidase